MRVLRAHVMSLDASWWAKQIVDDTTRHSRRSGLRDRSQQQWASAVA
jgi:hypothetical protein